MFSFISLTPLSSMVLAIFNDSPSTVSLMRGSVPDARINIHPFSSDTLIPSTVELSILFWKIVFIFSSTIFIVLYLI